MTVTTAGELRASVLAGDTDSCLTRAADDEPVFVLRAHDAFAPSVVDHWCMLVNVKNGGKDTPKIKEARALAKAMYAWQRTNGMKIPD